MKVSDVIKYLEEAKSLTGDVEVLAGTETHGFKAIDNISADMDYIYIETE